mgnify:CR=1 FL=1
MSEGGFKSKLETPYANQWITAFNGSCSIWNWVEVYGDLGILKNKFQKEKFVYDSGIRLNLVSDYFELFFPMIVNLLPFIKDKVAFLNNGLPITY